ncbi:protein phosphatase 1 regulatory subunit 3A [Triplophysa dalaica]|uniref:protein phosphatase 1 regulatory subunit 3A n=1 Tax=Triplophysa dalaica TaxID=1582913 RepID=UPI0024E0135F|nr:protein phosphatase 1 regulatory subunit 3A [Triplophysa dalaica]
MAQGSNNNFLTIPSQEDLFRTVRVERSDEENNSSPFNDEDDEETEEDARLIPRCSPVPRKRGPSIADETAEYMRIRLGLPDRRVSFADSTGGGELVDVRVFVPFDSEEEDESRWMEEEARYQKAYQEPTYRVLPEFQALTGTELVLSVHTNKLEVESVTSVPDEPLAFKVLIRVLNVSFQKSVYVRSTMDGWITHFDYPADYVQGSNDDETDMFSVKLSFSPPYLFNGARINFVVRYETSDGEFWANNSGQNYSVTLLQSYEEDNTQSSYEENIELRGILKPPRYRANTDYDESNDEEDDLRSNEFEPAENKTSFGQRNVVQPEIDIDTAKNLSSPPQSTRSLSRAGCPLSTTASLQGEPLPLESTSSYKSPQDETTDETVQSSTLHKSQSQSTSQFCESLVDVFNVVLSMPVPTVFVHPCDENYESEDSNKPDHSLHPQQDDIHPEIPVQVPFELGQHLSGRFSDAPHIQEEDDLKKKYVVCIQSEIDGTGMNVVEEQSQNVGEEKTENYFDKLEESVPPPFSKSVKNYHTTEDVEEQSVTMTVYSLIEAQYHPLETGIQEQEVEFVSLVTAETSKTVEVMLTVESTKKGGEEMDGLAASCLQQDRETHSAPICPPEDTSNHELNITQEEPNEDPNNGEQGNPVSTSNHQTTAQETSELASISETSSMALDIAFYPQPSTVLSSAQEDLTCQGDKSSVIAIQTCKDLETTLPLPRETGNMSTVSKNETEVILERCVTASFTCFSAAVLLAVGFQDPSIFLVVGLFLLSLCY